MTDGIDFQRTVGRFAANDVAYIVDLLRGTYRVMDVCDEATGGRDSALKLTFGDFINALEECDVIEIVKDEEMLVDEG